MTTKPSVKSTDSTHDVVLRNSNKLEELYIMLNTVSAKLDAIEQAFSNRTVPAVPRRATKTKKPVEEPEEPDEQEETDVPEDEVEDADENEEKLPVKKPIKKTKASAKKVVPTKVVNIMQAFKAAFKEDEEGTIKHIKEVERKSIAVENAERWATLKGTALTNDKASVYYKFMSEHYKNVLEAIKKSYLEQVNADSD
jgi:outer membrane biosynthesis protein TonB